MDYRDRHVVVTGGTGALGTATVGALVGAGAVCHVPYIHRAEAERFAFRDHPQVRLVADVELTEEAAVARLYGGVLPIQWGLIICQNTGAALNTSGHEVVYIPVNWESS